MFLCDIVDTVGETLNGLGLLELPVIGNILVACLDFWWDLLGC